MDASKVAALMQKLQESERRRAEAEEGRAQLQAQLSAMHMEVEAWRRHIMNNTHDGSRLPMASQTKEWEAIRKQLQETRGAHAATHAELEAARSEVSSLREEQAALHEALHRATAAAAAACDPGPEVEEEEEEGRNNNADEPGFVPSTPSPAPATAAAPAPAPARPPALPSAGGPVATEESLRLAELERTMETERREYQHEIRALRERLLRTTQELDASKEEMRSLQSEFVRFAEEAQHARTSLATPHQGRSGAGSAKVKAVVAAEEQQREQEAMRELLVEELKQAREAIHALEDKLRLQQRERAAVTAALGEAIRFTDESSGAESTAAQNELHAHNEVVVNKLKRALREGEARSAEVQAQLRALLEQETALREKLREVFARQQESSSILTRRTHT